MKKCGGGLELARTRSGKHTGRQDWNCQVDEAAKQPEEVQVPVVDIRDASGDLTTRLMGLGVNVVECSPVDSDEFGMGTSHSKNRLYSPKGLGTIAPQLFNLEPRSRLEKPLNIDFGLYQMEKL